MSLVIRQAQLGVLNSKHEDRLTAFVKENVAEHDAATGDAGAREVVKTGTEKSQRYGLVACRDIGRYIAFMTGLGRHFDTDPRYPWAGEVLRREDVADEARLPTLLDVVKAADAGGPLTGDVKRTIEAIYRQAEQLPRAPYDGVSPCPLAKRRTIAPVLVFIQEAPRARIRLPRRGVPLPALTLHALGHPGGGQYMWQPGAGWAAGIVQSVANLDTCTVHALASGATELRVVYTTPAGSARATCWMDVVAPAIVTTKALDFGAVAREHEPEREPEPLEITIDNNGGDVLLLDHVGFAEPTDDFVLVSAPADGSPVAIGGRALVHVRFKPSCDGVRTARIVVDCDDPQEPSVTIPLRGRGTAPEIVVDEVVSFGPIVLGQSVARTLRITNRGEAPLELRDLVEAEGFRLAATERRRLGKDESMVVTVHYSPTLEGDQNAVIRVASNDPSRPLVDVRVVGIGVRPKLAILCEPADFGGVTIDRTGSEPRSLRLKNTGTASLNVGDFHFDGEHRDDFGSDPELGDEWTLDPGEERALTLTFTPHERGARAATLCFTCNDIDQLDTTIPLTGTGLRPQLEVDTIIFDDVVLCFGEPIIASTAQVTVRNTGDAGSLLDLTGVVPETDHADYFSPEFEEQLGIPSGEQRSFTVTLLPGGQGSFKTALLFKSNDPGGSLQLPVVGKFLCPILDVTPRALVFATVPLDGSVPPACELRICNRGDAPLTVTQVRVRGSKVFAVPDGAPGDPIPPGGSAVVRVTATPDSAQALLTATLDVVSNGGLASVTLEASAYDLPTFTATSDPLVPGVTDAKFQFTVHDPKSVVTGATLEVLHPTRENKVIHTLGALTSAHGVDNAHSWFGAVDDPADHIHGLILPRHTTYTARVTITRDPDPPMSRTCTIAVAQVGELRVELVRHNVAKSTTHATFRLKDLSTGIETGPYTMQPGAEPDREALVVRGLAGNQHTIELLTIDGILLATYLADPKLRLAPDHAGRTGARVVVGAHTTVSFALTRYTAVQFIGFHAPLGGENRTEDEPSVMATYHGEADDRQDMIARCELMKAAMSAARANSKVDPKETVLKVFMAPEFYFRGQGGAYPSELVEEIPARMLEAAKDEAYTDWVFVYGTAVGYLKHGEATPEVYDLRITQDLGGSPQRVLVAADTELLPSQRSSVDVCAGISEYAEAPADWKLRQSGDLAGIRRSRPLPSGEYELKLQEGAPKLTVGPVTLIEPLATEVFNIALVQRGGPDPVDRRDLLVYKEYVSSIDFLGLHHPDMNDDFNERDATHAADIHGTPDRLILPTRGSSDLFSSVKQPAAAGVTSEQNRSGQGGGSLFTMAGINFGLEVCLDHAVGRLNTYALNATTGDSKPQVHLIPSWGMSIAGGPIYAVPDGLVFNVDGRRGAAPQAGRFNGKFHCPDQCHRDAKFSGPSPIHCPEPHFTCKTEHRHFQTEGPCLRCGKALKPIVYCVRPHEGTAEVCVHCNAPAELLRRYCLSHPEIVADLEAIECSVCGESLRPVYQCVAPRHVWKASCPDGHEGFSRNVCMTAHAYAAYAEGECVLCGALLEPERRKLVNDWRTIKPVAAALVEDPGDVYAVHDESIVTRTVLTDVSSGSVISDTTVVSPPGQAPIELPEAPLPAIPPTTDNGSDSDPWQRTWVNGPLTLTSVRRKVSVTGSTRRTETTTITTTRKGEVEVRSEQLLAQQGGLYIFPARDIPPAETV